jgi:hypothetical protein
MLPAPQPMPERGMHAFNTIGLLCYVVGSSESCPLARTQKNEMIFLSHSQAHGLPCPHGVTPLQVRHNQQNSAADWPAAMSLCEQQNGVAPTMLQKSNNLALHSPCAWTAPPTCPSPGFAAQA